MNQFVIKIEIKKYQEILICDNMKFVDKYTTKQIIIQLGLNLNIRQKPSVIMLTHMYNLFVCLFCKFWLKYSIKCPMNIYIIRINNNMKIDTHFSMQEMSSQLILCAKKTTYENM